MDTNVNKNHGAKFPYGFPTVSSQNRSLSDAERKLIELNFQQDMHNVKLGNVTIDLNWALRYLQTYQKEKSTKDKVVLCDTLWDLSAQDFAVQYWIKSYPSCVVEVVKIADKNVKLVVTTGILQKCLTECNEYLLAMSSVGILANVLAVKDGRNFMRRISNIYELYNLLVSSVQFLDYPQAYSLKKEILRCMYLATRCLKTANQFRASDNIYKLLKTCLKPNNSNEIIEYAIMITQNLLFNVTETKLPYGVIEKLPAVELKFIAINGEPHLKQKSEKILKKAANIYRSYHMTDEEKRWAHLQESVINSGPPEKSMAAIESVSKKHMAAAKTVPQKPNKTVGSTRKRRACLSASCMNFHKQGTPDKISSTDIIPSNMAKMRRKHKTHYNIDMSKKQLLGQIRPSSVNAPPTNYKDLKFTRKNRAQRNNVPERKVVP